MPRWVCVYPRPRNIGWPFGVVKPGQVVEHDVCPYPECFVRVAEDDDASEATKRRGRPPKETATAEPVAVQERKGLTSAVFSPRHGEVKDAAPAPADETGAGGE